MRVLRALMIAAMAAWAAASAPPAQAATKLTFLYTAVSSFLGAFVAKDEGFFEKRGVDMDLILTANGSTTPAALVANSAQLGGPTPTVLLQANDGGLDLVIVAGCDVYPTAARNGVLARPGSNLQSARDLAGKKVGVPGFNGIIDVLTRKWVQSSGLDYRKVVFIEVMFPSMGDALKTGLVDSVALVDPFYSRLVDTKAGYAIGSYASIVPAGTMPVFYVSTRDWATRNPGALKAFRDALDEAVPFIDNPANLARVRASLAKYTRLPPQIADTLAIPNNLTNRVKPEAITFWITLAREQGMIKGNPSPASLIAP
jgi:NitT/TauT family transport system substrate-binding protein